MATMTTLLREHEHERDAAAAGARAIAPFVVGLVPLALTVGTAAAKADLPPLAGWISSALLYGGSAQLTWMQMLHSGAPAALVVGTTLMVNLQMLMYGATMRSYCAGEARRWRVGAAHLLVSAVFGVATAHHQTEPDPALRKVFYMTAGLTLWSAWLALTGIGYACGGLPSVPVLTILTPLVMVSLALRVVVDAGTLTSLVVGAAVAVLCIDAPYDLGLVGAGVVGVLAGLAVDLVRGGSVRQ
jgi:predicted branched-subunit amino acid permease